MIKALQKQSNPLEDLKYVKRVHIYCNSEGIVVSADIMSKSRPGLTHYTKIVLDSNGQPIKASCDCEGYLYRHKCWHIRTLKFLTSFKLD